MQVTGLLRKNAEDHLSMLTANVSLSSSSMSSVTAHTSVSTSKMTADELEKVCSQLLCNTIRPTHCLRSTDVFRRDLKTFLFHSVYGHQDTD